MLYAQEHGLGGVPRGGQERRARVGGVLCPGPVRPQDGPVPLLRQLRRDGLRTHRVPKRVLRPRRVQVSGGNGPRCRHLVHAPLGRQEAVWLRLRPGLPRARLLPSYVFVVCVHFYDPIPSYPHPLPPNQPTQRNAPRAQTCWAGGAARWGATARAAAFATTPRACASASRATTATAASSRPCSAKRGDGG